MAAKSSQSGARMLKVLETLAGHQPIGTRALARILDDDKSAVQRAIATLSEQGWVRRTDARPGQWEVAPRILAVVEAAFGGHDLKRRARPALEKLRDASGETAVLVVPDVVGLVVADVIECRQMLRVVVPVGSVVAIEASAAGRAILSLLAPHHQAELLGREPDAALLAICAATRERGYSISERETQPGTTSLGCALVHDDGHPCGAISVSGPCERLEPSRYEAIGTLLMSTARTLSSGSGPARGMRPVRAAS